MGLDKVSSFYLFNRQDAKDAKKEGKKPTTRSVGVSRVVVGTIHEWSLRSLLVCSKQSF